MAFRHQSKGHAFTTRSQAAKEAERLRPNSDIFKVTVLGLAKTGKTSMCTQIVNHFFPQVYRHTSQTDSFITRVTVNDAMGETTPVIAHSRDPIDRYQLELQDTPGEIWRKESGGGVDASEANRPLEHTPEHSFTTELAFHNPRPANPRQFPRKPDYKSPEERYRDNMNIIFGDYEEAAKLRKETDPLLRPRSPDRDNSNHLLRARPTMGYIVMFDPTSRTSFEKAKRIVTYARTQHHPRTAGLEGLYLPMFLFANKMDLFIGQSTGNDGDDEAGASRRQRNVRFSNSSENNDHLDGFQTPTDATIEFDDEDPTLLQEAKAWVASMCNAEYASQFDAAGSGDSARTLAQQFKSWTAYRLSSKFVQLCYGSVKLNQVKFWDDARGGNSPPAFRLEELFNRMASQMAGQLDFVQRIHSKAEQSRPHARTDEHAKSIARRNGLAQRRKPRSCNFCLAFLWDMYGATDDGDGFVGEDR